MQSHIQVSKQFTLDQIANVTKEQAQYFLEYRDVQKASFDYQTPIGHLDADLFAEVKRNLLDWIRFFRLGGGAAHSVLRLRSFQSLILGFL